MKSKVLILSSVLFSASLAAAPAQAHDAYSDLWPLYGLAGIVLLHNATSHDRYYSKHKHHHRPHYRHHKEYSHSHGRYADGHHGRDRHRRHKDSRNYDRRYRD